MSTSVERESDRLMEDRGPAPGEVEQHLGMLSPGIHTAKRTEILFLAALTLTGLYFSYLLLRPYVVPAVFAIILAIVFDPLHDRSRAAFRNPTSAALLTTLVTLVVTVLPIVLLGIAMSRELVDLYRAISIKNTDNGDMAQVFLRQAQAAMGWLHQHLGIPAFDLTALVGRQLEQASSKLVQFGAALVANIFNLVAGASITFLLLFFLFRDGHSALTKTISAMPMTRARAEELFHRIGSAVTTNFYGGLSVAAAQGLLAGIGFCFLGVQSAVLLGFTTAVASLVPVIGSATVWGPITIFLLLGGHWGKALLLMAWGAGVVSMVDNALRPLIVRSGMNLHLVLVFFALLGGLRAFGLAGLFVGPVILSVTMGVIGMLSDELKGLNARPT